MSIQITSKSASVFTGVLAVANGGTGETGPQLAMVTQNVGNVLTANSNVLYDTIVTSTTGSFSTVTGAFTASVAGFYQVNAAFSSVAANNIMVAKNGTQVARIGSNPAGLSASGSYLVQLAIGDTVSIQPNVTSTNAGGGVVNYFTINLIH